MFDAGNSSSSSFVVHLRLSWIFSDLHLLRLHVDSTLKGHQSSDIQWNMSFHYLIGFSIYLKTELLQNWSCCAPQYKCCSNYNKQGSGDNLCLVIGVDIQSQSKGNGTTQSCRIKNSTMISLPANHNMICIFKVIFSFLLILSRNERGKILKNREIKQPK